MGTTGTLLVGIACVLAQGTPEAEKLKQSLTPEEVQLIEQLRVNKVCEQLDRYTEEGRSLEEIEPLLMGCQACIKTTTFKSKPDEK